MILETLGVLSVCYLCFQVFLTTLGFLDRKFLKPKISIVTLESIKCRNLLLALIFSSTPWGYPRKNFANNNKALSKQNSVVAEIYFNICSEDKTGVDYFILFLFIEDIYDNKCTYEYNCADIFGLLLEWEIKTYFVRDTFS